MPTTLQQCALLIFLLFFCCFFPITVYPPYIFLPQPPQSARCCPCPQVLSSSRWSHSWWNWEELCVLPRSIGFLNNSFFFLYSSSISNIHRAFRLNLDALKKDLLPTALTHLATHNSLKPMNNVLQTLFSWHRILPSLMCMSFLFILSQWRGGKTFKYFSFSHQLRLALL